jgi:hypothetical protein
VEEVALGDRRHRPVKSLRLQEHLVLEVEQFASRRGNAMFLEHAAGEVLGDQQVRPALTYYSGAERGELHEDVRERITGGHTHAELRVLAVGGGAWRCTEHRFRGKLRVYGRTLLSRDDARAVITAQVAVERLRAHDEIPNAFRPTLGQVDQDVRVGPVDHARG